MNECGKEGVTDGSGHSEDDFPRSEGYQENTSSLGPSLNMLVKQKGPTRKWGHASQSQLCIPVCPGGWGATLPAIKAFRSFKDGCNAFKVTP